MFQVLTKFPVAFDSQDTIGAYGGPIVDNSREYEFNKKLNTLIQRKPLWIMDLGCSGGPILWPLYRVSERR